MARQEPLRGVMVGCGHVSQYHLAGWREIENCTIVAVADRIADRAERAARRFQIQRTYSRFEDMLEAEQPDFVDIATQPDSHLSLVTMSAEAGAHVLCQKPVAPDLRTLSEMIEICETNDVMFAVNENFRFQPWCRHIRRLLDESAVGQVHHVDITTRARLTHPNPDFTEQPYFADMPRLLIYEFGIHMLDVARYLHGEMTGVFARVTRVSPHIVGEDAATIVLTGEPAAVIVDLSWSSDLPPSQQDSDGWLNLRIEGSSGTLELTPDWRLTLVSDEHRDSWQFRADGQAGYTAMQRHFVAALDSGALPETAGVDNHHTMELVFGAYHSAANGDVYRVGADLGLLE